MYDTRSQCSSSLGSSSAEEERTEDIQGTSPGPSAKRANLVSVLKPLDEQDQSELQQARLFVLQRVRHVRECVCVCI